MSRLDDKTSIPLFWAVICSVALITWTGIAATWVKGVNDRLGRIEHYLGIPGEQVAQDNNNPFENQAFASSIRVKGFKEVNQRRK